MNPAGRDAVRDADLAHAEMGTAFRRILASIARIEERRWRDDGARDAAHWTSMHFGISEWKARRWLVAAEALPSLPEIEDELVSGGLSVDKVLELCRFATPETSRDLVLWAQRASCSAIRRRGDASIRRTREETLEIERSRYLHTWYSDEGRRMGIEAELPASDGAIVERALERVMRDVAAMPDEDDDLSADARRADALVAMAMARIGGDPDPDRATVVIHAPLGAVMACAGGGEVQDGPPVPSDTVRRLLCTGRFQTVTEDAAGDVVALGEMSRLTPAWMLRQVRYRDRECGFPGCSARRFTEAHHITFWCDGGRTTLDNLLLICAFHHRLVHEYGWRIERSAHGVVTWHPPGEPPGRPVDPSARGPTQRLSA